MAKKQRHMNYQDRLKMEAYLKAGKSVAWIAGELGFCERTIYYEKKRGQCTIDRKVKNLYTYVYEYSADKGQIIHTRPGFPLSYYPR